jgi:hypothetical protein
MYSISAVTPFSKSASLAQWLMAQVGEENNVIAERRVLTVTTNVTPKVISKMIDNCYDYIIYKNGQV